MRTKEELRADLNNPNVRQFLNTIALSEGTVGKEGMPSDMNGYNVGFSGTTIADLSQHPGRSQARSFKTRQGRTSSSSAAGRYQFMPSTWNGVAKKLGLSDFGPESQDLGALALIDEKKALDDIIAGDFGSAAAKLGGTWTSLPTGGAGGTQNKNSWNTFNQQVQLAADMTLGAEPQMGITALASRIKDSVLGVANDIGGDFFQSLANNIEPTKVEEFVPTAALTGVEPVNENKEPPALEAQVAEAPRPIPFPVELAALSVPDIPIETGTVVVRDGMPQLAIPETSDDAARLEAYSVYDENTRGRLLDIYDRLQDAQVRLADERPLFNTNPTIFDAELMNIIEQV